MRRPKAMLPCTLLKEEVVNWDHSSSASDMELSEGGSDVEAIPAEDNDSDGKEKLVRDVQEQTPADEFPYEGLYKTAQEKATYAHKKTSAGLLPELINACSTG